MPTPFVTSRVYLKPLLPHGLDIDPEVALKRSKRDLLRRVKAKLTQTTFSRRAKIALAKAIKIEIKPSSLIVTANHPAYRPLVEGQRKGQMRWLVKARAPIPIITEDGRMIFRSATAKTMADGKWIHPGRPPTDFVTRAKKESREFLKEKFEQEIRKQVRSAFTR